MMKITTLERIFIVIVSLVLNKLFLFWIVGASSMFVMFAMFALFVLNIMILAKSVDKLIEGYEQARRKQPRVSIKM